MLADAYDSILFDLDGVLYRGEEPVPGASEAVERLRASGTGVSFVTNNSSATTEQVAGKLESVGIAAPAGLIATSAVATAEMLARQGIRSAFVVGEEGIRRALADRGIEIVDAADAADAVDAVVVGWDRSADYEKLKEASLHVQRGARLVATNDDAAYPAPDGLWPGAGALLATIVTTTGARPDVVGKPHPPLFEVARELAGGGRALFVGDRLDTDIAGAASLGWDSFLVFTGVTRPADLLRAEVLPTFAGPDLRGLSAPAARIRPARQGDGAAIDTLLASAGLETIDPQQPPPAFVAEDDRGAAGTVAYVLDDDAPRSLLRSLAVRADRRHSGLGMLLTATAVRECRGAGAREVYAVTESAEGFFVSLGFERAGTLEALPEVFRGHAEGCDRGARVLRLTFS